VTLDYAERRAEQGADRAEAARSSGTLSANALEEPRMKGSRDDWSSAPRSEHRRRGSRRRGRRRNGRDAAARPDVRDTLLLAELDESMMDPEERAYAEAHRVAEEKVRLWGKFWKLAIIGVPLALFIPWLGLVILLFGGIDLARKAYRTLYEPKLRERLVDEEVSKRIQRSVHAERRTLEGEHARSLERLSASIAHEIRNPITAAKSLVQQMGEDPLSGENVEYAKVALGELERVERSISHLLRYAREEEMRLDAVRMADVLDSAIETFRDRAAREGVEIVRSFDNEGALRGDAEMLRRIAINLIGNAMDALADADEPAPRVEVALGENLAGTEVWVRIADNGAGIDPAVRDRIFNPFYTSKEHGTGLGLPITKKIVEAHGGSIDLESTAGAGTEFVLTFPKSGPRRDGE
jgi:signal transduction histidine kinase